MLAGSDRWARSAAVLSLLLAAGCGGARGAWAVAEPQRDLTPPTGGYAGGEASVTFDSASTRGPAPRAPAARYRTGVAEPADRDGDSVADRADAQERYAQAETQRQESDDRAVATDATSAPLLIYTAELGLAVHQVSDKQDRVEEITRELGGFLARRTDREIVVRVPARAFEQALAQIQELGDVITRNVQVQDVTEEFHDVQTRIRTLEAMRARVEQLLQEADDVQAALAVEQHLERITVELERLRGRLRFLSDRVAFSTITVRFTERTESREPQFQLPFSWLRTLGLETLMTL